jgi:hypothetical protein
VEEQLKRSLADSACRINSNKVFDADFAAEFLKKTLFFVKKRMRALAEGF